MHVIIVESLCKTLKREYTEFVIVVVTRLPSVTTSISFFLGCPLLIENVLMKELGLPRRDFGIMLQQPIIFSSMISPRLPSFVQTRVRGSDPRCLNIAI
jgi:hypothetical protein